MAKWTNTVQSQIFKAVDYTFENALQVDYFNLNNGLRSTMFNVIEQALGDIVRFGRAPTVFEAENHSLIRTKPVADKTIQSVLSDA